MPQLCWGTIKTTSNVCYETWGKPMLNVWTLKLASLEMCQAVSILCLRGGHHQLPPPNTLWTHARAGHTLLSCPAISHPVSVLGVSTRSPVSERSEFHLFLLFILICLCTLRDRGLTCPTTHQPWGQANATSPPKDFKSTSLIICIHKIYKTAK